MFFGAAASSRVRHFYCRSGTEAAVAVMAAGAGEEQQEEEAMKSYESRCHSGGN